MALRGFGGGGERRGEVRRGVEILERCVGFRSNKIRVFSPEPFNLRGFSYLL